MDRRREQRGHRHGEEQHRLKYRPLRIFWAAAELDPDRADDSAKAGETAEQSVQDADAGIGCRIGLDWRECWPCEIVGTIHDQQGADADAQVRWIEIGHEIGAERNTNGAADDKRQDSSPLQCMADLPDAIALVDHPVSRDENRRLQRRDDVQPDARHDQSGREAGQAAGESAEKCREKKKRNYSAVHSLLPSESDQRLGGRKSHLTGRLWRPRNIA
jgi:hypothetical protein